MKQFDVTRFVYSVIISNVIVFGCLFVYAQYSVFMCIILILIPINFLASLHNVMGLPRYLKVIRYERLYISEYINGRSDYVVSFFNLALQVIWIAIIGWGILSIIQFGILVVVVAVLVKKGLKADKRFLYPSEDEMEEARKFFNQ